MANTLLIRARRTFFVTLLVTAVAACSGDDDSDGPETGAGGSGAAGASGASGSAGSGGSSSGGSNSGGSAGAPPTEDCPEASPAPSAACGEEGVSCFYGECDEDGRSVALCSAGAWTVETRPCTTFPCANSEQCMPGEICSITAGGAFFGTCMPNPCGDGPITCECVNPSCPVCMVADNGGVTVTCNTCPAGNCP